MEKRSAAVCLGEREKRRNSLAGFTPRDAESVSKYVFGKWARLQAYREAGGAMTVIEVCGDFVRDVKAEDPSTAYLVRCLSRGDLEKAKHCIAMHPALAGRLKRAEEVVMAVGKPFES